MKIKLDFRQDPDMGFLTYCLHFSVLGQTQVRDLTELERSWPASLEPVNQGGLSA